MEFALDVPFKWARDSSYENSHMQKNILILKGNVTSAHSLGKIERERSAANVQCLHPIK